MKVRVFFGAIALALAAACSGGRADGAFAASGQPPQPVHASRRVGQRPRQNLSSTASSSWQTDNTVWALAYGNGVVYVGGQFPNAPAGRPAGYRARWRAPTWPHSTPPPAPDHLVRPAITADGSNHGPRGIAGRQHAVRGRHLQPRQRGLPDNLAAFNTSTGALTSWASDGARQGARRSPRRRTGRTIYIGGDFDKLDGAARTDAGRGDAPRGPAPCCPGRRC